jgi:KDO2-lipid IV(A) lauroyltransferase
MLTDAPKRFEILGAEGYQASLGKGNGVILAISHLGSWEYLSFICSLCKIVGTVVVKQIKNPLINQRIDQLRRKTTVTPVPKQSAARHVLTELKQNHTVAILIDQWAGPEGIWTSFFGRLTSTTSIPARLAEKTGAVIIPAFCIRTRPGHYRIEFKSPIEFAPNIPHAERVTTDKLNRILEDEIRKYPTQWLWAHRRWKPKPRFVREDSYSFTAV